jgi:hypothetical protein
VTLIAVLDQHRGHNSVYYYDTYYLNTPNYFAQKINLSYSYLLRLERGLEAHCGSPNGDRLLTNRNKAAAL